MNADVRAAIDLALTTQAASLDSHRHQNGAENCPVCNLHDHSDTRRAGHTNVSSFNLNDEGYTSEIAVPMWWLTCPMCGWPEIPMNAWTTTALDWAKSHGTLST